MPFLFGVWLLLPLGGDRARLRRAAGAPAAALGDLARSSPARCRRSAADFRQTFLKAVLAGYAIGSGAGFLVAILVDRVPFLQRGLLPIGNLVSALPIIGIAPIMVMWFGFDWPSKAAVVVDHDLLPDAGEHGRRARRRRAHASAT